MIRLVVSCFLLLAMSSLVRAQENTRHVHTRDVNDLALSEGALWTATTGGIERYELTSLVRTHHLTQAQGLDELVVLAFEVSDGKLVARTRRKSCVVDVSSVRCSDSSAALPRTAVLGQRAGAAITKQLVLGDRAFVATRGTGLWVREGASERALTPAHQICTNHVQALAHFRGELWIGGFSDGLCVARGAGFSSVATPFRFVNALLVRADQLFVAAHEGLFVTRDGAQFERVESVPERGVNGLALGKNELLVTTPASLYRIPFAKKRVQVLRSPAGSRAIQALAVHGDELWLATEDRGALRIRGKQIRGFDALTGLDSSWALDVVVGGDGTTYVATLRHGVFAIAQSGHIRKLPLSSEWPLRLSWLRNELWVGTQDGLVVAGRGLLLAGSEVHALLAVDERVFVGSERGLVIMGEESGHGNVYAYGELGEATRRPDRHPAR